MLGPALAQRRATVAMFHLGRSGSTVLSDLVGQHPDVYWDGEIYEWALRAWERRHQRVATAADAVFDAVEELARCSHRVRIPIYGFEAKFFQVALGGYSLAEYIARSAAAGVDRFILLRRRNSLRVVVSAAIADQTQRYHNAKHQAPRLEPVRLDPEGVAINRSRRPLLEFLKTYDQQFSELDELLRTQRVLRLCYEDDIADDPQVGYRRVCEFLGLRAQSPRVRFGRTMPFELKQVLLNFDEVERALAGSRFQAMLYD